MSSTVPLLRLHAVVSNCGLASAAPACDNEKWPVRERHAEDGREVGERAVGRRASSPH